MSTLTDPRSAAAHTAAADPVDACSVIPDPDVMFPTDEDGNDDLPNDHPLVLAAKAVCNGCQIRDLCGEAAMGRREPWGVWGGMTRREVDALRRRLSRSQLRSRQLAARQSAGPAIAFAKPDSRVLRWAGELDLFEVEHLARERAERTPAQPTKPTPHAPAPAEQLDLFEVSA